MLYEVKVGSVSWIHAKANPTNAIQAIALTPEWIPKTYMGLVATADPSG